MADQLATDYTGFATATQAITLTPQQSLAVQDASRANADLLDRFKNADMQSMEFNAWSYSLNYTQTGCYRPGALPVALAMNDTCMPGFHCKSETTILFKFSQLTKQQAPTPTMNTRRNTVRPMRFVKECALWARLVIHRVCWNLRYAQMATTVRMARKRSNVRPVRSVHLDRELHSNAPTDRYAQRAPSIKSFWRHYGSHLYWMLCLDCWSLLGSESASGGRADRRSTVYHLHRRTLGSWYRDRL